MSNAAQLLEQRAQGHVKLHMGMQGVERLREQGSSKLRIPPGSREAILINTSGGLAGGDHMSVEVVVRPHASLTVTSQAAERVYRTLGPPARVETHLVVEEGARLLWLPNETILFDHSSLHRSITVELAEGAFFVGLETAVYGRTEMNEKIGHVFHRDDWRVTQGGKLIHAEAWKVEGPLPASLATLQGGSAIATLVVVGADVGRYAEPLRLALGEQGSASAWNGKLVARLLARDGFTARKRLVSALSALAGELTLPKTWTL